MKTKYTFWGITLIGWYVVFITATILAVYYLI